MKKLNSEEKPIPDSGLLEPFIKLIPANCDDTFKKVLLTRQVKKISLTYSINWLVYHGGEGGGRSTQRQISICFVGCSPSVVINMTGDGNAR